MLTGELPNLVVVDSNILIGKSAVSIFFSRSYARSMIGYWHYNVVSSFVCYAVHCG